MLFKQENAEYIFEVQTKAELEKNVSNILASNRAVNVIQGLINASLNFRAELKESVLSEETK